MKSIVENDDGGVELNNENNWLGFSLSSPHHHVDSSSSSSAASVPPTSFYMNHHASHLSSYGFYYGIEPDNNNNNVSLYSGFPVMPLKSDGTLYGMDPLINRAHPQQVIGSSSTPKLENLLGGGDLMETPHHYECSVAEAMPLSLDTIFHRNNHQPHLSYYHGLLEGSNKQSTQASDTNDNNLKNWGVIEVNNGGGELLGASSIGTMSYGGDLQSLSLSMSPSSQSSCVTSSQQRVSVNGIDSIVGSMDATKKRGSEKVQQKHIVHRKSIDTFGQRTSQYRGVTRHRWTGRYEAHLWDNSCKKEGQSRKGRQGGYDMEEKAARAYDMAALKYWGPSTHINFPLENYQNQLEEMKNMTRQEYVAHLRRKSSGFSRGASMYRGVTRHHQHGRWQARIGRVAGNKDLYLGTFSTQEEAAEAYDIAAIKFRGVNAVTNFDITRYDVEKIMASNNLLSSELAWRNKEVLVGRAGEFSNNLDNQSQESILMQISQSQPRLEAIDNMFFQEVEDPSKIYAHLHNAHASNPSSLATSLNSSREGSPENRTSLPMLSAGGVASTKLLAAAATIPVLSLPQMPVFAAWTDA
ncbi:hypothetical protein S83_035159 [Arachis hypogaea]